MQICVLDNVITHPESSENSEFAASFSAVQNWGENRTGIFIL